ncbi:MAG: hypothetical protein CUN53_09680 [Phototrophicales bacterium]|nr:MAG: hypothetical protein CUN53_09680 [Phototrophicales bacterium]
MQTCVTPSFGTFGSMVSVHSAVPLSGSVSASDQVNSLPASKTDARYWLTLPASISISNATARRTAAGAISGSPF